MFMLGLISTIQILQCYTFRNFWSPITVQNSGKKQNRNKSKNNVACHRRRRNSNTNYRCKSKETGVLSDINGQQDCEDDASIGDWVLPPRPAVFLQSRPEGGLRRQPILQVHSLQTRRRLGPGQGLFQARRLHRSSRVRAPALPHQGNLPQHRPSARVGLPGSNSLVLCLLRWLDYELCEFSSELFEFSWIIVLM